MATFAISPLGYGCCHLYILGEIEFSGASHSPYALVGHSHVSYDLRLGPQAFKRFYVTGSEIILGHQSNLFDNVFVGQYPRH